MKITRISVHQVDVPVKPATISHHRVMSMFDETIVRVETDAGVEGWGDIDVYFEQPCATYEECRDVRRTTGVPLILDESATDVGVFAGRNTRSSRHAGRSAGNGFSRNRSRRSSIWKMSGLAAPRCASLIPPSPVFSAMPERVEARPTARLVEALSAP